MFRPLSPEHPEDETFPGLLLLRPAGTILFANAHRLGHQIQALIAEYSPKVLVLYMRAVPDLEYTALRMLTDGEEKLREAGTVLWLVGMNPDVLMAIQRSPLGERLGRERMLFTLDQAVTKYLEQIGATAK